MKFLLPAAESDYVQRSIATDDTFHERELLERLDPYLPTGAIVVDVGANIGNHCVYWTLFRDAKVHAFEPVRLTHSVLVRNISLNGLEAFVAPHHLAVGAEAGTVEMFIPKGNPSLARSKQDFRDNLAEEPEVEVDTVPSVSLDGLLGDLERLDFIKIDVEGFEADVLRGAETLIRRFRPVITVEVWPRCRPEIEALLRGLDYCVVEQLDQNNFVYGPVTRSRLEWHSRRLKVAAQMGIDAVSTAISNWR